MNRHRAAWQALVIMLAMLVLPSPDASVKADPVSQLDENLVVAIASPREGEPVRGIRTISGYAADRRSAEGAGLNARDIQVYLDYDWRSPNRRNLIGYAAPAPGRSIQAEEALGPQFSRSGFSMLIEACSLPPGQHTLTVWVSSLVQAGARQSASVQVEILPCPSGAIVSQQPNGAGKMSVPPASSRSVRINGTPQGTFQPTVFGDFAAGVDASCMQPDPHCSYGLYLRQIPGPGASDTDELYRLIVRPSTGSFGLEYWPAGDEPNRMIQLIPETASGAISRGTGVNRLGVLAEGDTFRIFVNGQRIGEVRDDRRLWGEILRFAENSGENSSIEVAFDRPMVSTLGSLETLLAIRVIEPMHESGPNVVLNGSLEDRNSSSVEGPLGWAALGPNWGRRAWENGIAHTGVRSISINGPTIAPETGILWSIGWQTSAALTVDPSKLYRIAVWARADSAWDTRAETAFVGLRVDSCQTGCHAISLAIYPSTEWQEFSTTIGVPDGATAVRIVLYYVSSASAHNNIYFDDVSLIPIT